MSQFLNKCPCLGKNPGFFPVWKVCFKLTILFHPFHISTSHCLLKLSAGFSVPLKAVCQPSLAVFTRPGLRLHFQGLAVSGRVCSGGALPGLFGSALLSSCSLPSAATLPACRCSGSHCAVEPTRCTEQSAAATIAPGAPTSWSRFFPVATASPLLLSTHDQIGT